MSALATAMRARSRDSTRVSPVPAAIRWNGMHGPALADAVDAADALLEPHRVPRQFKIDDEPAGVMQIEPFAGGVGGEQHGLRSA